MDFELHYTAAQEEFRKEVRAWLRENTRPDMRVPIDPAKTTEEQYLYGRELMRKLGAKGWRAPLYPKEYGGGGLTVEEEIIISEELDEQEVFVPSDSGLSLTAPSIMVWGNEDQRKRFLPAMLRGEVLTWQAFTEPEAGTDLASLRTRAEPDGDDFVLNGEKMFIGFGFGAYVDWLYTLAITDPSKPRHANMGAFIVSAKSPGVTLKPMSIVGGPIKYQILYKDVRVPGAQLIGGETDGWRVAQSTLEVEHGGSGSLSRRNRLVEHLFDYCRETSRNGRPLSKDPAVRDTLVDVWIGSQVQQLFAMRNYWMRTSKVQWAWEGSQNSLYGKLRGPKTAKQILSILGPYALTTDPKLQALAGEIENNQRASILTHPGGTPEAQKIIMARRIGIARTKQSAAAIV